VTHPPRGLLGGGPGARGRDLLDGVPIPAKTVGQLRPGATVTFETPGGGGFGPAAARDAASIAEDVAEGYVTRATPSGDA
jgi:N-methylhydantoinase B